MDDPNAAGAGPSEDELIRRCCARPVDHEAWLIFYDRHYRTVRNHVKRYTGSSSYDPDDLAQEAFVKIFRALPTFDRAKSALPTFLSRIVTTSVIDYLRHGSSLRRATVPLETEVAAFQLRAEANPVVIQLIANEAVKRAGNTRRLKIAQELIAGRDAKEVMARFEATNHEVYTTRKWLQKLIEEIGAGWR